MYKNEQLVWGYSLGVEELLSKTLGSIFSTKQLRNGSRDSLLFFSFLPPNYSVAKQMKAIQLP